MDQEEHAPANKRRKVEKDELTQESIVQIVDNNAANGKSVCSPVVYLTNDAWLLVFNYLACIEDKIRIGRVCKRWRELGRIFWKGVTSLSFEKMFESPFEGRNLTNEFILRRSALDLVSLYSTSLQELKLSYMDVPKQALKTLAERLPRLQTLSLECCMGVGEHGLRPALKMLQSLKSLNVSGNDRITGGFFSQAPLSLVEVFAMDCYKLSDRGVHLLARRCPNLETIDISQCWKLTGQSITDLVENCPKLKRFKLRQYPRDLGYHRHRHSDLIPFLALSKLPLLEVLHVDGHISVTDEVFTELGRYCPLLRSISFIGCHNYRLTNAAIYHLSRCRHLESIYFNDCSPYYYTNEELFHLSLAHRKLKKVHLSGRCYGITDEGVGHLLSAHPNLLELNISSCRQLTDSVLPILESSLLHRKLDQPLKISLPSAVTEASTAVFEKSKKWILHCKW